MDALTALMLLSGGLATLVYLHLYLSRRVLFDMVVAGFCGIATTLIASRLVGLTTLSNNVQLFRALFVVFFVVLIGRALVEVREPTWKSFARGVYDKTEELKNGQNE